MAYIGNLGFNQMSPYGCGCGGGMQQMNPYQQGFMMGQQMAQMQQMMQMMMGMMQMMMQMQGMGGGFNPMMNGMNPMMNGMGGIPGMGGGFPAMGGGFPGMGGGIGNYMGGGMPFSPMPFGPSGYPGGGMPYGPGYANGACPMPGNFGNSGSAAVSLGQRFLGQNSIDVRGRLPHFTAAGGQTNNCADFVSSCLESTGGLQGHHVGVRALEQALIRQGYRRIPASMAKPGDVWMNPSRGHTELVATPGATQLLGSNNDRPGHQVISQKPNRNPEGGVYYSRG
ncbi:hypothetical protein JST97_19655 [bacterium]|nr:hypothetical protein [bacterium]